MLSPTTCAGACPEFRLPDTLVGCAPSLLIQWCNVLIQTEGVGMDLCSRNRIGHVLKHCRVAKKELRASPTSVHLLSFVICPENLVGNGVRSPMLSCSSTGSIHCQGSCRIGGAGISALTRLTSFDNCCLKQHKVAFKVALFYEVGWFEHEQRVGASVRIVRVFCIPGLLSAFQCTVHCFGRFMCFAVARDKHSLRVLLMLTLFFFLFLLSLPLFLFFCVLYCFGGGTVVLNKRKVSTLIQTQILWATPFLHTLVLFNWTSAPGLPENYYRSVLFSGLQTLCNAQFKFCISSTADWTPASFRPKST